MVSQFDINQILTTIQDIPKILARLQTLENWRDQQAEPNIKNNINNINVILTNIQNNILPSIEKAKSDAVNASKTALTASDKAVAAGNLAIEAKNTAEGFLNAIRSAQADAANAINQATSAFDTVQGVIDRFLLAAAGVEKDIGNLQSASKILLTTLVTELSGIGEQIKNFGTAITTEAKAVGAASTKISDEIVEAIGEMKTTLDAAVKHAQELPKLEEGLTLDNFGRVFFLPFNLYMMSRFLLWKPDEPRAVMLEFLEGIKETSDELKNTAGAVVKFGEVIVTEAGKITERIALAGQTIDGAFNRFINAFFLIFRNLSLSLRGEPIPQ